MLGWSSGTGLCLHIHAHSMCKAPTAARKRPLLNGDPSDGSAVTSSHGRTVTVLLVQSLLPGSHMLICLQIPWGVELKLYIWGSWLETLFITVELIITRDGGSGEVGWSQSCSSVTSHPSAPRPQRMMSVSPRSGHGQTGIPSLPWGKAAIRMQTPQLPSQWHENHRNLINTWDTAKISSSTPKH